METISFILFLVGEVFVGLLIFVAWIIIRSLWKIPIVVFRFVGNKSRPTLLLTKGRVINAFGVNRLVVKKYKTSFRNFKSEYYYPTLKGAGGLILWEFKPGWLTPITPRLKGLTPEEKERLTGLAQEIAESKAGGFEFDESLYKELLLKAVDDTDSEWYLRQQQRIATQYTTGWRDFLSKYGGHMLTALIVVMLFVGFVVWLKEAPNQAGQCIAAGVEAAKATYLSDIASGVGAVIPPG